MNIVRIINVLNIVISTLGSVVAIDALMTFGGGYLWIAAAFVFPVITGMSAHAAMKG